MNDSNSSLIVHLVSASIVAIFATWLTKSIRAHARTNRNGEFILEYPVAFKAGVVIIWVVGALVAAAFYLHGQETIAIGAMACFAALGFPLYLIAFTFHVEFDALNIQVHSLWRSVRLIPWNGVQSIRYQSSSGAYVVESTTNGKLRLKSILAGLETFLDQAEKYGVLIQRMPPLADRRMQSRRI